MLYRYKDTDMMKLRRTKNGPNLLCQFFLGHPVVFKLHFSTYKDLANIFRTFRDLVSPQSWRRH